jgi:C1A family cysteine protease
LLSTAGFSWATELDDIKAAIKAKGAKWTAGETSVSKLPAKRRKTRVSAVKPLAAPEQAASLSLLTAPTGTYDWRDVGGTDYVTSIKDQGDCGSCWAFATTAADESFALINDIPYNQGIDLSEQILLSCSGAGTCSGGYIDQASNFIQSTGLPPAGDDPYTATNSACSIATTGWQSTTTTIPSWSWVTTTAPTADAIKNALFTNGPLVTTMQVYADFYSYTSGVYTYTSGALEGGHAILIVGYTDDSSVPGGGYFIVKNSWGTAWGMSGYFEIAYSELTDVVQFGYYTISYNAAAPTPPPAPACTYAISPTSKTFSTRGGTGSISVTAGSSCAWTAKSNESWITITSGKSGTGSSKVAYSVPSSKTSRTGTISILEGSSNTVIDTYIVNEP